MKFFFLGLFLTFLSLLACTNSTNTEDNKLSKKAKTSVKEHAHPVQTPTINNQTFVEEVKEDSLILKWLSSLNINTKESLKRKIYDVIISEVYGFDYSQYDSNYLLKNNAEIIEGLYITNKVTHENDKYIVINFVKDLIFIQEFSFVFDKKTGDIKEFLELFNTELNKQKFVENYKTLWNAKKSAALNNLTKMTDAEENENYKKDFLRIYENIKKCKPPIDFNKIIIKNNRVSIIDHCGDHRDKGIFEFAPNLEFNLELIDGLDI